jgi:hypothetical protein
MTEPTGKSQASHISSNSEFLRQRWLVLGLIFGAGVLAVALHEVFRWPMKLPGRHGLELMAILLFVRCASGERYAATLAALGGASLSFLIQHNAGIDATILLLQGLALDGMYRLVNGRWWAVYILPVIAGLAHAIKPLVKMLYQAVLGIPSDSLIFGLGYPLLTHFIFGLVGGLVGVMACQAWKRAANSPNNKNQGN